VVGDTIVDIVTYCAMIGADPKTATLSGHYERTASYVGGAGIVAKHMAAAGGLVTFSTVLGDDDLRYFVLDDLEAADMDVTAVIDPSRPTVNKEVIAVANSRPVKISRVDNRSISDQILGEMVDNLRKVPTEAVVFSDFRHGIFNRRTIPGLIQAIPQGRFRAADSQVSSRWGNITDFQGFDLITPNEREARWVTGDQDSGIRPLALKVHQAARAKCLILKLREHGTLTQSFDERSGGDDSFVVDSFAGNVVDPVGAGDALLAYATLAMLATKDPVTATILGCSRLEWPANATATCRSRQRMWRPRSAASKREMA